MIIRALLVRKSSVWIYRAASVFVCLLVAYVFLKQTVFWNVHRAERATVQREKAVAELIRECTGRNDVVAVGDAHFNMILPTRIHRYRFFAEIGRSVVSPEENLKRYLFISKLLGRSWEEIKNELTGRSNIALGRFIYDISVPDILTATHNLKEDDLSKYAQFYEHVDGSFLRKRRVDYIIIDRAKESTILESSQQMGVKVKKVSSINGIVFYSIHRNAIYEGGAYKGEIGNYT